METLANLLKGLSDPTRLRILNLLAGGELCVCDLIAILDVPQSTISRHLAYLRKSGWIEARRNGKWMYYRRPLHCAPFQAYAYAMLDDEFVNRPTAKQDSEALVARLNSKTDMACAYDNE